MISDPGAGPHTQTRPPVPLRALTSFPQFAVRYSVSQNQRPVGFQDGFSVLPAEQPADLLQDRDASLRRHVATEPRPPLLRYHQLRPNPADTCGSAGLTDGTPTPEHGGRYVTVSLLH